MYVVDVEWQLASRLPSLRPARSPLDLRQRCWRTVLVTPKLLVRLSVLVLQTLHNTDASKHRESDSKHPCWLVSLRNQRVWRLSIKSTHLHLTAQDQAQRTRSNRRYINLTTCHSVASAEPSFLSALQVT